METKKAEEFLKNRGYTNRVPFPYSTVVNQMTDFANQEIDKATTSQQQTIERLKSKISNPTYLEYAIQTMEAEIDSIKEELHSNRSTPSNRFPRDQYLFMWVGHRQALRVLKNLEALLNTTEQIESFELVEQNGDSISIEVTPFALGQFYCAEKYRNGFYCESQCDACKKADELKEPIDQ